VIAADNDMIKHAVRKHFEGVDDKHVTSYFDKLIQVPISVPPLGTQEVRAYMMLLFVETSTLKQEDKDTVRTRVCEQLGKSWQGKRVDRAFLQSLGIPFPGDLVARFDAADRLAPLMATAKLIEGNPRLIKRFLNALAIRMAIANAHGIAVEETILAKLLLFERCGNPAAFKELVRTINLDKEGKPRFLAPWEEAARAGQDLKLENPWDEPFFREWLTVPPPLADQDLRGALYVSREHTPIITPEDRLTSAAAELLTALLEHPDMAAELMSRLAALQRPETMIIFDRVLERARQVQEWGVPPELEACLAVTRADPTQGPRLAAFLEKRPSQQITAALIPKISAEPWAKDVFARWEASPVSAPVKRAIARAKEDGNV
jgi:predicted KAP-like P-loop ATPase